MPHNATLRLSVLNAPAHVTTHEIPAKEECPLDVSAL